MPKRAETAAAKEKRLRWGVLGWMTETGFAARALTRYRLAVLEAAAERAIARLAGNGSFPKSWLEDAILGKLGRQR